MTSTFESCVSIDLLHCSVNLALSWSEDAFIILSIDEYAVLHAA